MDSNSAVSSHGVAGNARNQKKQYKPKAVTIDETETPDSINIKPIVKKKEDFDPFDPKKQCNTNNNFNFKEVL